MRRAPPTRSAAKGGGVLKHLLVHVDSGERAGDRLALAVALARRFEARLTGLFAEGNSLGRSAVARRSPQNMEKAAARARSAFEAAAGAAGLEAEWWQVPPGEYGEVVGWSIVCCRHAALAVLGQREPGRDSPSPDDIVEQVVAGSGRPVLVVPYFGPHAEVGSRILVAWTGNREAARALSDAIPLLRRAAAVRVLALQHRAEGRSPAGLPTLDVAAHLRLHGIAPEYERVVVDDIGAVAAVLNGAAEFGADLVVMGDHGEGGFPFVQRGNTTREILASMTTPVLLSR